jgi:hypothetical protein
MANALRRVVAAVLTFVAGFAPIADAETAPAKVAVRIVDRAHVQPDVMSAVTKEVSAIFEHGGVEMIWLKGSDRVDFLRLLVILDPEPSKHTSESGDTMGVTLDGVGDSHRVAYVFVDRIERVSREAGQKAATVLAYVLAHELGHLLLPAGSHTKAGIMQARWDLKALSQAAQGVYFTREQAARMRAKIVGLPTTAGTIRASR